jgi:sentrin-specific protease 1
VEERLALRLRPLSEEDRASVDDVIGGHGNPNEVLIKEFKVEMTRKLMRCFKGLTWLNDEVINFNMEMLNARDAREVEKKMVLFNLQDEAEQGDLPKRKVWCCKSFLMTKLETDGYKGVKRWSKRAKLLNTTSIFDLLRMVVPVNIANSHWTSVQVDLPGKRVLYYDSMGGGGGKYMSHVMEYLKGEHLAKLEKPLNESEWTCSSLGRTVPQQENCSDCGMFTSTFATYETDTLVRGGGVVGLPLNFSQSDMPYFRKRLALDILNARID